MTDFLQLGQKFGNSAKKASFGNSAKISELKPKAVSFVKFGCRFGH